MRVLSWVSLGVLGLVALLIFATSCDSDWQRAERDAKAFVVNIPGATGNVACAKADSDGDGYCSCTVFMEDGSMQNLDCGCEPFAVFDKTEGCKVVDAFKELPRKRR